MRIRKMREGDTGEIVRLIHNVYGKKLAQEFLKNIELSFSEEKAYKFKDFFVLIIENKIAGVGGVWALHNDPIARLDWFLVDNQHQRKGLGTFLLKHIEKKMTGKGINILTASTRNAKPYKAAIRFYEKNGFEQIAEIKKYWDDGSAWLYFMKRI